LRDLWASFLDDLDSQLTQPTEDSLSRRLRRLRVVWARAPNSRRRHSRATSTPPSSSEKIGTHDERRARSWRRSTLRLWGHADAPTRVKASLAPLGADAALTRVVVARGRQLLMDAVYSTQAQTFQSFTARDVPLTSPAAPLRSSWLPVTGIRAGGHPQTRRVPFFRPLEAKEGRHVTWHMRRCTKRSRVEPRQS